ncbi:MAG: YihY/virulence factor BrkB family protein [Acidimicrobiales bacterium]
MNDLRSRGHWILGFATSMYDIGLQTYTAWRADRTIRLGAGLAYYALFTIVPLFALSVVLVELLFAQADMQRYIADRIGGSSIAEPEVLAELITETIAARSVQTSLGLVGLASLLFAASLLFLALFDAINTIWNVPVRTGMWNLVRRRLIAFLMVLATMALLVTELVITAFSGAASAIMPGETAILDGLAQVLTHISSWAALAGALTLLNRYAGPVRVEWPVALASALPTAAALVIGTSVIGLYLQAYGGASVSGAVGALFALLTWVYIEAQILLVGIQLTKSLTMDGDQPPVRDGDMSA